MRFFYDLTYASRKKLIIKYDAIKKIINLKLRKMEAHDWITFITFLSVCDSNVEENEPIEIEWVLADKN